MQAAAELRVEQILSGDDFVWTLGQLCALHRVPFDPRLFLGQFPPPYTYEKLLAALGALGFDAGHGAAAAPDLKAGPFPSIAFQRVDDPQAPRVAPAILAACDGERVVLFRPGRRE